MFEIDLTLIVTTLVQLLNGGGAGWLAFKIWQKFMEWWPTIKEWRDDLLRISVFGTCMVIAWAAYGVLGWLGATPWPTTPQEWVSTFFSVAFMAFTSSQMFHGHAKAVA